VPLNKSLLGKLWARSRVTSLTALMNRMRPLRALGLDARQTTMQASTPPPPLALLPWAFPLLVLSFVVLVIVRMLTFIIMLPLVTIVLLIGVLTISSIRPTIT
jgi:hypothetical protein